MDRVQTTCNYCALACNLDFEIEGGVIANIAPTPGYPVNKGKACIKGLSLGKPAIANEINPLPRVRGENGDFGSMPWNEAFEHTAERIKRIVEQHGGEAFAAISTGQMALEEMALLGHVARNYLKSNVDGNTRLCTATAAVAHKQSLGFDAPGYTLKDLELSDTIILIGANPVVAHPMAWERINGNKGKKLVVIDARKSETAAHADYFYEIKPKADLTLLYTLANILIQNDWIDRGYVGSHCEDFEEFKAHVSAFGLDSASAVTGISAEGIMELAELIHAGKRVSLWWTMGVNQGYQAVRTAQAILNIAVMTGNIGREGTGANSITGQSNAMGARLFSNTTGLFGGGDFDNPNRRNAVCRALGLEDGQLASKPTIPYNAIIEGILAGEIKGLWVICTNPAHSWANNDTFRQAMEKLELLIVQDIYGDTDTSSNCGIYLPVVPGVKKEGTIINTERRLSALRPVVGRGTEAKTDYEVIYGIGQALGMGDMLDKWKTPRDAFNLMKKCSEGMPCDISGIDYDRLANSSGIQWPFREGDELQDDERRLYSDGRFYHSSGKFKFVFEDIAANPIEATPEFPYMFNTGRGFVGQWHTQTRTREIGLDEDARIKEAYVLINPQLASKLGIEEGNMLEVSSINGKSAVFKAQITENQPLEQLFAPMHYIETNRLTPSIYDAYSKEPSYKSTPVCVSRVTLTFIDLEERE
ncbi:MAG: molybdopterin oxidoreductase family protein [Oscillospiraceae bacterium]|nr:molybdopterin oxidoreductase family protein [Oscillospiraceae bacterium]